MKTIVKQFRYGISSYEYFDKGDKVKLKSKAFGSEFYESNRDKTFLVTNVIEFNPDIEGESAFVSFDDGKSYHPHDWFELVDS